MAVQCSLRDRAGYGNHAVWQSGWAISIGKDKQWEASTVPKTETELVTYSGLPHSFGKEDREDSGSATMKVEEKG